MMWAGRTPPSRQAALVPIRRMRANRRGFLTTASGLVLGSQALGDRCANAGGRPLARAKTCILVHLLGGPPHLDMWDLKPQAPAEIRGPFQGIATSTPGLFICEHLPRLARMAQKWSLIRSLTHHNHNHTPMIYYSLTGRPVERPDMDNDVRPPQRGDHPHLGAVVARFKASPSGLPGYVAIPEVATRSSISGEFKRGRVSLRGGGSGILGPLFDPLIIEPDETAPPPFVIEEAAAERLERRAALMRLLDRPNAGAAGGESLSALQRRAVAIAGSNQDSRRVFRIDDLTPAERDRYGSHRFGRALLIARRLAEAETPCVAIHWNEMTVCDGWDTHARNFEALQSELLPMLDQGLSALITDLDERGLLSQTLILVFGEFGRTPRINKDAGRDHWGSCQSVLLAGGGVQGGRVLGASDRIGAYPASDPFDPIDLHATLFHCLGIDPSATIHDPLRRPHAICNGRVIQGLF